MVDQVPIPHSVVDGKEPLPAELIVGGLAVNLKDFTLYTKGYDNVVIRLTGVSTVIEDDDTAQTVYLPWVKQVKAGVRLYASSEKLSFNPSTGRLRAISFVGNGAALTGFTTGQIEDALGFLPIAPTGHALAGEASNLETVIALANSIRSALISSGIAS